MILHFIIQTNKCTTHTHTHTYIYINIILYIVSTAARKRWAVHVTRMGRGEAYTGFWWGNLRKRDHWGDPDEGGRIILR
jgi:hypothetical protein